jgi:HEPN domain-containing protein
MDKIPTAEEFLENYRFRAAEHIGNSDFDVMIVYAKEFAKLHVKAALEEAANNSCKMSSTRDTIRNAYDLDNIR